MKTFNTILGVFAIIGAVYCLFFPGMTFLQSSWIVAMLLGVYGVCSIFEFFSGRKEKKKSKFLLADGFLGLILGIGAAIISVSAMFDLRLRLWLDLIILILFSCWLVYSGISSVFNSFALKKSGGKLWILTLILGILTVLAGGYGVTHLIFTAISIGFFMGTCLMIYGFRLIASVFEKTA